jgi:predicted HicB family RNase H-like nuclease
MVSLHVRLPEELHAALRDEAARQRRSLNNLIVVLLTREVNR